jgi:hypothetical protein
MGQNLIENPKKLFRSPLQKNQIVILFDEQQINFVIF